MSRVAIVAVVLGFALACTGTRTSPPAKQGSNREACETYVRRINALERCLRVRYDADNLCAVVDATSADMTRYFDCLATKTTCEGTVPRLEVDDCEPPLVGLAG
jgi:hypothetical protein